MYLGFSLIFFSFISNSLINNRVEKNFSKKVVVEHFYNGFNYKLSPENFQVAQRLVDSLCNDPIVYKKFKDFYKIDSLNRVSLFKFERNEISKKEILNLIDLKENYIKDLSKEIHKNNQIKKQLDSLFNVFLTNPNFRKEYNNNLIFEKIKKNPFSFFYAKRLDKKIQAVNAEHSRKRVVGFRGRYLDRKIIPKSNENKVNKRRGKK